MHSALAHRSNGKGERDERRGDNPTCYTTATRAITRTNTIGLLLCCCAEVPGARYTAAHTGAEPPGLPESESSSIIGTS